MKPSKCEGLSNLHIFNKNRRANNDAVNVAAAVTFQCFIFFTKFSSEYVD